TMDTSPTRRTSAFKLILPPQEHYRAYTGRVRRFCGIKVRLHPRRSGQESGNAALQSIGLPERKGTACLEVSVEFASARMGGFHQMATPQIAAQDRLIVALDCATTDEARDIVRDLDGVVSFFKIGLILQLAPGTEDLIRRLI